ncbi:DUF2252 domain-containing protein [Mesorhizobium sp. C416B]|uniref:DUF2252 family protein n=1 Tax=unclassified Mesorhizobium TaxID=325217 RepID=UPI0003CEB410|nr:MULTISPECIES: DUF2252 family protein [unclassified Mesorhizobium]ESX49030.1 hypothetical protein X762_12255 [Mesorhizobium sp. LSHC426A00]ESX56207.1 hypothetical protein X761_12725 [Mesorhizobium sp. LSHC424B00]ESX73050.1 hypothetical protein X758_12055 [Mesorhizobium sp. LSHC416B00]WJI61921.1 DUF2252 domain-containing protein [Mesorhizobium sp. C416B]
MNSFQDCNSAYETWLRTQCDVIETDLEYKHERMRKNPFTFLRATFFRWAREIAKICPELANAPSVLSVGDTHTENFGTWRDADARLVWGVNDFDEAAIMPYPFDLVRLATSVQLAPGIGLSGHDTSDAITTGYRSGLRGPRPTLVDERAVWMRRFVMCTDSDCTKFWEEVQSYPTVEPPADARRILQSSLPATALLQRFASRRKGGGGLGKARFVAIANWQGGQVIREAKASVPSAWYWAHGVATDISSAHDLSSGEFRSPDPFLRAEEKFIVRRIAVDSRKLDLGENAGKELDLMAIEAMGFELGSIHAASTAQTNAVRANLDLLPDGWLRDAVGAARDSIEEDYTAWCSGH